MRSSATSAAGSASHAVASRRARLLVSNTHRHNVRRTQCRTCRGTHRRCRLSPPLPPHRRCRLTAAAASHRRAAALSCQVPRPLRRFDEAGLLPELASAVRKAGLRGRRPRRLGNLLGTFSEPSLGRLRGADPDPVRRPAGRPLRPRHDRSRLAEISRDPLRFALPGRDTIGIAATSGGETAARRRRDGGAIPESTRDEPRVGMAAIK